ncbi:GDSL-type esterase/lipase family protein [Paenibacillus segetis]|uniref:SGNH hydrolase-type esterase domain-containing protein n=1 Tax=Paenibacillus segetis TaxID=1325360 RepID=A0ABQ1YT16_9BACL|nr:GDSL-type esterase/lipase family protein [Paenibacillus segetis]GGH35121.1 hypothetical protein GCM10008013_41240 [Paenibacillus segetis]
MRCCNNRGISGDSSTGVLDKLRDEVFDLEPSKVFLLIGTNDLGDGKDPQEVVRNIKQICTLIHNQLPHTKVYVESIYPVNQTVESIMPKGIKQTNEQIRIVNQNLANMTREVSYTYIDLYPKLLDTEGRLDRGYTYDGLHLNTIGYEVVKAELQLVLMN